MEDVDFPRGPLEHVSHARQKGKTADKTRKRITTKQDNLFQDFETAKPSSRSEVPRKKSGGKGKRKLTEAKGSSDGPNKKQKSEKKVSVVKPPQQKIESLSFKNLRVEMLLLGVIKEVHPHELVVSLPNRLTGFVQIADISDRYTQLLAQLANIQEDYQALEDLQDLPGLEAIFRVGMEVVCVVKALSTTRDGAHHRIQISLKPSDIYGRLSRQALKPGMVLPGSVQSIEDHGYFIDMGVNGTTVFLSQTNAHEYIQKEEGGRKLAMSQPIKCLLQEVKGSGKSVFVTIDPKQVREAKATKSIYNAQELLVPGTRVTATVTEVSESSLKVSVLSSYRASISQFHLETNDKKPGSYKQGQELEACMLYSDPERKLLGLTLQPRLVKGHSFPLETFKGLQVGATVAAAAVVHVFPKNGVLLRLSKKVFGYAHVNQLSDEKLTGLLAKRYPVGSKFPCRVIDLSYCDGLAVVSLKQSVLRQKFMTYLDIEPGAIIKGEITTLGKYGLNVQVTDYLKGFVPSLHLADVPLQHPEKKFKQGDKIKCRVLSVNPERKRLVLTHKQTLVTSDLPILASYEEAQEGSLVHGFVLAAKDFGCIVCFYSGVKGLIPKVELSEEIVQYPDKVFYKGQVVKCRVLSCQPANRKLRLSLKASGANKPLKQVKVPSDFAVGKSTNAKVDQITESGVEVKLVPSGIPAFIPTMHLSDHLDNSAMLASLKKGQLIEGAMYLHKNNILTLTMKESLMQAVQESPAIKSHADLKQNQGRLVTGYLKHVMPYGVFVQLPFDLVGLVPKSMMADHYVVETGRHYALEQSLVARVAEVDLERQRLLLSLKLSEVCPPGHDGGLALLRQYLAARGRAVATMLSRKTALRKLARLSTGSWVSGRVVEGLEGGVLVALPGDLTGTVHSHHLPPDGLEEGAPVEGCVLCVDYGSQLVELSLRPHLVEGAKRGMDVELEEEIAKEQNYSVEVELLKKDYVLVSLKKLNKLAYMPARRHLNDSLELRPEKLVLGKPLNVSLVSIDNGQILVSQDFPQSKKSGSAGFGEKKPQARQESESSTFDLKAPQDLVVKYQPGATVVARIKSIKDMQMNVVVDEQVPGRIHATEVLDTLTSKGQLPFTNCKVGAEVKAKVIGIRQIKDNKYLPITHSHCKRGALELTMQPSKLAKDSLDLERKLTDYKAGQTVNCFVDKYVAPCLWVRASPGVHGKVFWLNLSREGGVLANPQKHFRPAGGYQATVVRVDQQHQVLEMSLTGDSSAELKPGAVVNGCLRKVLAQHALVLQLPFSYQGKAFVTDLHDQFQEDPLRPFKLNQFVRCYVLEQTGSNHVAVSLRPSRVKEGKKSTSEVVDKDVQSIDDIKEGSVLRGYVKNCSSSGIFISLSRIVEGRVKFEKMSHYIIKEPSKIFTKGKLITSKVISVDLVSNKVDLSLLPEDTGAEDPAPPELRGQLRNQKRSSEGERNSRKRKRSKKTAVNGDAEGHSDSEDELTLVSQPESSHKMARLQVDQAFDWNASLDTLATPKAAADHSDSDDSDSDHDAQKQKDQAKRLKKNKEQEAKAEEELLHKTELALLSQQDKSPETLDDFDKLVLSSPNSSLVWVRYMTFHLHTAETEKARAVAERALKSISFREEQEKLNVWVAYLNLENMYGTQETLMAVFQRALQNCDAYKVFQHLVQIYTGSQKIEQAEQLYNNMVKRFSGVKDVWVGYGLFLMKVSRLEAARKLMQRSFRSLTDKEQVDVIVKFAQMEFKYGEAERGRTMFENVLSNYPKRTDLWSVYIDLMIKRGDPPAVRKIFERVTNLKVNPKKMKFFFKRYLDFEKAHGDETTVKAVKDKAIEYVESKTSAAL